MGPTWSKMRSIATLSLKQGEDILAAVENLVAMGKNALTQGFPH